MKAQSVLEQIDNIVVLMLENRSLDNVLGWLYSDSAPARVVPSTSSADFDGLSVGDANNYESTPIAVVQGTQADHQPTRVPRLNPIEDIDGVQVQMYADGYGNMPDGYFWAQTPPMTGFAWNFDASYETWAELREVMGAYSQAQLPVLYGLAASFGISDRWFSSVPTQTNPNRAFFHCGTSLGRDKNLKITAVEQYDTPTIWNALGSAVTWGVYYQDIWHDGQCYTEYTFPRINDAAPGVIGTLDDFYAALSDGTLPQFTFLEPSWGYGKGDANTYVGKQGNDYHPPTWVGPGEYFVNQVYDALRRSTCWSNTLLVITFDEHGGTYDHVPPPATIAPDGFVADDGFAFDRLGVRVPTILVSPFIPAGTVFRAPTGSPDFDHTSLTATILKWAGVDPASSGLGARVAQASTFESAFVTTARTDSPVFTVPPGYADEGGGATVEDTVSGGLSIAHAKEIWDEPGTVDDIRARIAAHARSKG